MDTKMVDVTLHINEEIGPEAREALRDALLQVRGVLAADYHATQPHLVVIEYDPDVIESDEFLHIAQQSGLHAQLIGM